MYFIDLILLFTGLSHIFELCSLTHVRAYVCICPSINVNTKPMYIVTYLYI